MYAEGETELRDLIVQNLESCGFLNKIKAELRAGVFLAFEEEGSLRKKIPLFNKKFDEFIDTVDGKLVVSIVREFLEYFNLNFTLSVFDPEIASSSPCFSRTELCSKLNLKSSEFDGPVLSALLKPEQIEKQIDTKSSTKTHLGQPKAASLEMNSDTFCVKDNSGNDNILLNDNINVTTSLNFYNNDNPKPVTNENINSKKSLIMDPSAKVSSEMVDKLKKETGGFETHTNQKSASNIISNNTNDIFTPKVNSSVLDHDPFFDEPVPSEKPSYFNLPNDSGLFNVRTLKDTSDKNTLSSLRDLPALDTKTHDWTFNKELPKTLPIMDPVKPAIALDKPINDKIKLDTNEDSLKKDTDPESNEDLSEQQLNSEESIEEDIEDEFSTGVDDLLNSSLSLGDDATSDQTVSQISVVDGVDHIEPCYSMK